MRTLERAWNGYHGIRIGLTLSALVYVLVALKLEFANKAKTQKGDPISSRVISHKNIFTSTAFTEIIKIEGRKRSN